MGERVVTMIVMLPIVVVEGYDVSFYSAIEEAEKALEPWWVRQHEGVIYDAVGHRLAATVIAEKDPLPFPLGVGVRERVRIVTEAPLVDAEELRLALIGHLQASGAVRDKDALLNASLGSLLARMLGRDETGKPKGSD